MRGGGRRTQSRVPSAAQRSQGLGQEVHSCHPVVTALLASAMGCKGYTDSDEKSVLESEGVLGGGNLKEEQTKVLETYGKRCYYIEEFGNKDEKYTVH